MYVAPAQGLRARGPGRGRRVREGRAPLLPGSSLTPREARRFYACLAQRLRELTGRGFVTVWKWLVSEYGFPWSLSTLKRLVYGLSDGPCEYDLDSIADDIIRRLRSGRRPHGSLDHAVHRRSEDRRRKRRRKRGGPPRRGRLRGLRETQRRVLAVLRHVYPQGATPSQIALELRSLYGERPTRNAVWQRLKRLERRGLVVRLPGGRYKLSTFYLERGYAENIRIGNQIIRRSDVAPEGDRASIDLMLYEAWLRTGAYYRAPIDSIEIGLVLTRRDHPDLIAWAERARNRYGWSYSKLYYRDGKLYLEHRLDNPPVEAHPAEAPVLRRILDELNSLNRQAWYEA